MIKIQWLASICVQNDQNVELRRETFKTTQNYKTDQITMNCIDWMSKRSKQRKTTKVIKLQWLACINVKTIKTKLNYKSDRNPMTCIYLTSKRSKMFSYVAKHSKLNYKSDQNPMTCIDLTSKRSKTKLHWIASIPMMVKTIKTKLNYKSDQNPMTCIDLRSKRSKCRVTSRNIQNNAKLQNRSNYNVAIGCQNDQNNGKLQKIKLHWLASIYGKKWSKLASKQS